MNESTKSKPFWGPVEKEATRGKGIDIGCGPDPVTPDARRFDKEDGDANRASEYVKEQFDFVYSSHCLEHMHDPKAAIQDWWKLVKTGGYLFVLVPDEDLYEQGVFPSRFNDDHKATFTISKAKSWSPLSHNVLELGQSLAGGEIVSLQLQDRNYDRSLMSFGKAEPGLFSRLLARLYCLLRGRVAESKLKALRRAVVTYYPLDQTSDPGRAQAQIQLIVKKGSETLPK
ncbi:MAG: class I SAM-dependent methyltransferase [Methylacidiphilales bacterium]|nr:class I SAM-dependent methyltransferase [Candidatus Methylacidiphilales bacterium]